MVARKNLVSTCSPRAIAQENQGPRPTVGPWIGPVQIEEREDPVSFDNVRRYLIAQAQTEGKVRSQLDGIVGIAGPKPIAKVLFGSRDLTKRRENFSQQKTGESIAKVRKVWAVGL